VRARGYIFLHEPLQSFLSTLSPRRRGRAADYLGEIKLSKRAEIGEATEEEEISRFSRSSPRDGQERG